MFTNLTNKLQSTLSNLADPHRSEGPGPSDGSPPPASYGSHAFDQLTHSLRTLQVQYGSSVPPALRPLQLFITGEKTLALAYESVGQAGKNHSRDLYFWGQDQEPDVKDVSDRLAWLSFSSGGLASQFGSALGGDVRAPLKQLRELEQQLTPRKAAKQAALAQLQRAQNPQEKAELQRSLTLAGAEDAELEARVGRQRREAVREAERAKWHATREYAEKLLLLCRGAEELLELIPPTATGAPTAAGVALAGAGKYEGEQKSADIKSAVQHALDTWTLGVSQPLKVPGQGASLSRAASDRRGFGETHAADLASSGSGNTLTTTTSLQGGEAPHSALAPPTSGLQAPPPSAILPQSGRFAPPAGAPPSGLPSTSPSHGPGPVGAAPGLTIPSSPPNPNMAKPTSPLAQNPILAASPPPLNPSALNQAPAPLPPPTTSPTLSAQAGLTPAGAAGAVLSDSEQQTTHTGAVPTIAETGLPIAAGLSSSGPGPKSGSLKREELHPGSPPPALPARQQQTFPTAEEEKRALQRAERDRVLLGQQSAGAGPSSGPPVPAKDAKEEQMSESEKRAKEEKRRLEREERERVLRGEGGQGGQGGPDDDLPPYAA